MESTKESIPSEMSSADSAETLVAGNETSPAQARRKGLRLTKTTAAFILTGIWVRVLNPATQEQADNIPGRFIGHSDSCSCEFHVRWLHWRVRSRQLGRRSRNNDRHPIFAKANLLSEQYHLMRGCDYAVIPHLRAARPNEQSQVDQ